MNFLIVTMKQKLYLRLGNSECKAPIYKARPATVNTTNKTMKDAIAKAMGHIRSLCLGVS